MTASDTLLITNDDIQAAIVDYTKTLSGVTSLLTTSDEIRELEWQGDDFVYPNIRVSVDLTPSINGCAPYKAQIHFDCFSEDKSSHQAQTIAGALQLAYHRVPFQQNDLVFSSVIVKPINRAQRSIYAWQSTVEVEVLVNTAPTIFSPTDISGLTLWLRADDISGGDGSAISSWVSREGNAYAFNQATGIKQPLLKLGTNGIGSQPVVRFDGANDILVYSGNFLTSLQGTLFIISRYTASLGLSQDLLSSADEASAGSFYGTLQGVGPAGRPYLRSYMTNSTSNDIDGNTTIVAGTKYLLMCNSNGSSINMRVNGVDQALTIQAGSNNGRWYGGIPNRDNVTIGGVKVTLETNFLKGDIAEIILYDTKLNQDSINQVEAYFASRYGPF